MAKDVDIHLPKKAGSSIEWRKASKDIQKLLIEGIISDEDLDNSLSAVTAFLQFVEEVPAYGLMISELHRLFDMLERIRSLREWDEERKKRLGA